MKENDLAVYIVPSEDEHNSEYVSSADQRRSFISGFTGSAGIAIITRDLLNFNDVPEGKSALSTDGRYFNQAGQELDYNWVLLKQGAKGEPTWQEWAILEAIDQSLGLGKKLVKIGIDPKLISYKEVLNFENIIKTKIDESGENAKVEIVAVKQNLVDQIWGEFEEVPKRPTNDLIQLTAEYNGEDFKSKHLRLLTELKRHKSDSILLSSLDEVAWLLNLRGSDIEYNPVFFSYVIVNGDETKLFTDDPYSDDIKRFLSDNSIAVLPYQSIWTELSATANILKEKSSTISIPETASWEIVRNLNNCKFKQVHSPIDLFKSVKNETEIKNFEKAQLKDAVAIIRFFAWLEDALTTGNRLVDEYAAGEKLVEFRQEQDHYVGNSFETISATGANAAVIHYAPSKENCSMIDPSKIYLCDTGSQFLEGTTDITRTLHFGTPSQEEIDNYTLVLKGNLAIENLVFPEGTNGYYIDVIARQFLWAQGLDYRHGTGHGVGSYLNVHEGPIGIGLRNGLISYPLEKGNIVTNEPGYYEDGKYGIRIENDMLVEVTGTKFGDKGFLKLRNLTLVPYCKNLINVSLLSPEEKRTINLHYKNVFEKVLPLVKSDALAYSWLSRETSAI
jgi:Xaa-Pro aminopeptidase